MLNQTFTKLQLLLLPSNISNKILSFIKPINDELFLVRWRWGGNGQNLSVMINLYQLGWAAASRCLLRHYSGYFYEGVFE